jgi:tetratricopeptide (TPR) repeat protein
MRIFLCYANEDESKVADLYARLEQDGFRPWMDRRDLLPGEDWEHEIKQAVRSAHIFLVCVSHHSVTRAGFVNREIVFALEVAEAQQEGTIFLIPVRLEETRVPDRIRRWHWCNYFEADGYERLVRALRKRAKQVATAHFERGNKLFEDEKHDEAIAEYTRAIELGYKPLSHAYHNRGLAYWKKQEYDRAIADYDQVIRLDENYALAYLGRGNAYRKKQEYDRAIAEYTRAIELGYKPLSHAYHNRGDVYRKKQEYDRAIADYDQAIRLDANYASAYFNRGVAYYYKQEYDRAIADYNQAIRLDANYALAYFNRGLVYKKLGRRDEAIADFKKRIELGGDTYWCEQAKQRLRELGA